MTVVAAVPYLGDVAPRWGVARVPPPSVLAAARRGHDRDERHMEFWSTIVGLLRRPKVVVPILLAALVLGAVAFMGTPVTYVSSTTMVLTTTQYGGSESTDPTEPTPLTNPMLNFNSSLATTSGILIQSLSTKEALKELVPQADRPGSSSTTAAPTRSCSGSTGRSCTSRAAACRRRTHAGSSRTPRRCSARS